MFIYKYSQLTHRISYQESLKLCQKFKMHLGQLKLFFSELMFLTKHWKPNMMVLYVGAAPGYHINKLADLFPHTKFELWDPEEFDMKENPNIIIHQKRFENQDAQQYQNKNILFICDIRTLEIGEYKKRKDIAKMDNLVIQDMETQKKWCQIINPIYAFLKFRLPFGTKTTNYLKGTIYLQPYSKISTEARLMTNNYHDQITYDNLEFEEKMAYLNGYVRCHSRHYHKWNHILKKYNIVNNWDNILALHITHFYLKRINDNSEETVGKLFMEIIQFHKNRYGNKYDVIFGRRI